MEDFYSEELPLASFFTEEQLKELRKIWKELYPEISSETFPEG